MLFLVRSAEGKKIIWSENSNRYLLLEEYAFEVITRLIAGVPAPEIIQWCTESYGLPEREGSHFVRDVRDMLEQLTVTEPGESSGSCQNAIIDAGRFAVTTYYQINDLSIRVDYENERLKTLIHPKFAHLQSERGQSADHVLQVYREDEKLILSVDGVISGKWTTDRSELLIGKFFVELLNRMYRKTDNEWMAVFHASGLSDGEQAILFTGESGSGKTTLSAILMSQGYQLLSDDMVPVDARLQEAFSFPAALSIKDKALELLLPIYPELKSAGEFYYPAMNKTVRYLKPDESPQHERKSMPCKAIVFVKYQPGSGLKIKKMPKDLAFKQLIPDSWISPVPENAEKFLDWFLAMPCYLLTYADNEKMVAAIKKLFENDLP